MRLRRQSSLPYLFPLAKHSPLCSFMNSYKVFKVEAITPCSTTILGESENWKPDLSLFSKAKKDIDKNLPRHVKVFYKDQNKLIQAFEDLQFDVDDEIDNAEVIFKIRDRAQLLAKISFFINFLLLIGKSTAAGLSGSLSVISSVIDSAVDLASGALFWWSSKVMKSRDIYSYPQGRTKLEPISIIILSVIMALASVQMIRESAEKIFRLYKGNAEGPKMGYMTISILVVTIILKFILFVLCYKIKVPSLQALSQDHRNDVLSNTVALICGYIGYKFWPYCDPIGAVIISIYILISWSITGNEQIKMLTGHTAGPEIMKKITWIALNHHPDIKLIDTVRVYHFGAHFIAEVDIVLPENMTLKDAHDIGETLQHKLEYLSEVERAFVHLDYESEHDPGTEHKRV